MYPYSFDYCKLMPRLRRRFTHIIRTSLLPVHNFQSNQFGISNKVFLNILTRNFFFASAAAVSVGSLP